MRQHSVKIPSGALTGTGDPELDGEVEDALELIERLAQSDRVRQSIIRHAFRFYMGRNEMLSDAQTLIDAEKRRGASSPCFLRIDVSEFVNSSDRMALSPSVPVRSAKESL